MVLLDIKLDNFLLFNDFSMNLSYAKKPVQSSIENEHLAGRPNFRYKKAIILMGANAKYGQDKLIQRIVGILSKES